MSSTTNTKANSSKAVYSSVSLKSGSKKKKKKTITSVLRNYHIQIPNTVAETSVSISIGNTTGRYVRTHVYTSITHVNQKHNMAWTPKCGSQHPDASKLCDESLSISVSVQYQTDHPDRKGGLKSHRGRWHGLHEQHDQTAIGKKWWHHPNGCHFLVEIPGNSDNLQPGTQRAGGAKLK